MNFRRPSCVAPLVALAWLAAARAPAEDAVEFFERQVRPVLVENCLACHGPAKQHGGLRLDARASILTGGDRGPAIDLDHPADSLLLEAIAQTDPDLQMPPKPAAKLPASARAAIEQWIRSGAPWPAAAAIATAAPPQASSHWSFQPIQRAVPPAVQNTDWPQSPVDQFVLARLEAAGMTPAPPAERRTLIRRATLDLTGLPPQQADIEAFVADPAPDAFARLVDRLLDSPHYGERWGRYWLDVARYADTKGYVRLAEERNFHYAFTYRDYVVRAFNEDLPYDRFISEQLAADQLSLGADQRPLAALGFLTLGRRFTSNKHDIIDDRIDVVSRGLLGLTVTCARCHDHKYDPIPTADYYALYGVFSPGEDPVVPPLIGSVPLTPDSEAHQRELDKRQQALDEYEPRQYQVLLDKFRERSGDYLVQALAGRQPPQQPLPAAPDDIRQWVVERWIDHLEQAGPQHPVFGPWHAFAALPAARFVPAAAAIIESWQSPAADPNRARVNARVQEYFTAHRPQSMTDVARGYGELLTGVQRRWHDLVASHAAAGSGAVERLSDSPDEELRAVLYAVDSPVEVGRHDALYQYLYDNTINNEVMNRRNAVYNHLAATAKLPPRAHTLVDAPALHDPRILVRGNPMRPGRSVPRHFLSALCGESPPPLSAASARLELARAITGRDNPLTARVLVNRVWAHHFGAGLVRTPSNFGARGELPTHPELLDHLAARFIDEGWSVKKLHRWIMLSSTYQQSCSQQPEFRQRDPENRLLGTMNRRRLDFETLRDSLLSIAGRLDLTIGGPSVDLAAPTANRRTLYGFIDRQGLPAMFATFDFASPDTHTAERYATTVPQQALFLLNSPLAIELARAFAARDDVRQIADPALRFARMTQLAWGRAPTEPETRAAVDFIAADVAASAGGEEIDPWTALAQSLLLANELLYVE